MSFGTWRVRTVLGTVALAGLALCTIVLSGVIGTMLWHDTYSRSVGLVMGSGLVTGLGLVVGAAWLFRQNRTDDRFHAGLLLALAVAVTFICTATGMFSALSGLNNF